MGIGRSFEEGFQKALRMVNDNYEGFSPFSFKRRTEKAVKTLDTLNAWRKLVYIVSRYKPSLRTRYYQGII